MFTSVTSISFLMDPDAISSTFSWPLASDTLYKVILSAVSVSNSTSHLDAAGTSLADPLPNAVKKSFFSSSSGKYHFNHESFGFLSKKIMNFPRGKRM